MFENRLVSIWLFCRRAQFNAMRATLQELHLISCETETITDSKSTKQINRNTLSFAYFMCANGLFFFF